MHDHVRPNLLFPKTLFFPQCSKFLLFKFQKKIREFKPTLWIGLVEESSRSWLLHNTVGLKSWLVIQKSWTNLGFCFDEIGESNLGTKKFKRQRSCIIGSIQLKYIVKWKNISIISKIKIPSTNANHYGIFLLDSSSFILLWKLFGSRGTIFASASVLRRFMCA